MLGKNKNPAQFKLNQVICLPKGGRRVLRVAASGAGHGNTLSSLGFPLFSATVFAGFFIGLFHFKTLEQPIILNFLLKNAYCLFDIVVINFD